MIKLFKVVALALLIGGCLLMGFIIFMQSGCPIIGQCVGIAN